MLPVPHSRGPTAPKAHSPLPKPRWLAADGWALWDAGTHQAPVREGAEDGAVPNFSPATQAWFDAAFAAPTTAQVQAWEAIAGGRDTVVIAPTGSGFVSTPSGLRLRS